jgi:hypothetical protein
MKTARITLSAVLGDMSKASINNPPVPKSYIDWSGVDNLQVGGSVTFPVDLYTKLNNALVFRTRREKKKFTRRASGDVLIVWRLS